MKNDQNAVSEIHQFNSQEVAKILGVNVSTVKRWTDEGKLECVKTVGGHRKFLLHHLAHFLKDHRRKTSQVNLFPLEDETDLLISHSVLKGNFDFLTTFLYEHALLCDRSRVQQVLNGLYLGQYPLHKIYDRLITPVLYTIGKNWEDGNITVTEEHLASQTIRDSMMRLQGIIKTPTEKSGVALCLNFPLELHDIALKMVDHVLEARGFKILFSGQVTPIVQLEEVFRKVQPDRVYLSSTIVDDIDMVQQELDRLADICQSFNSKFFVGGSGLDKLNLSHPAIEQRLFTFEDVFLS